MSRVLNPQLPYTDIECELDMDTGEGVIDFVQLGGLVRIMDIQSQREELYIKNDAASKRQSKLLLTEQEAFLKQHFDQEWPKHEDEDDS